MGRHEQGIQKDAGVRLVRELGRRNLLKGRIRQTGGKTVWAQDKDPTELEGAATGSHLGP